MTLTILNFAMFVKEFLKESPYVKKLQTFLTLSTFLIFSTSASLAQMPQQALAKIPKVSVGMDKNALAKIYPKPKARTYRQSGTQEWLTFNYPLKTHARDVVSFHLNKNKVKDWQINNRAEVINEYLSEFSSQAFVQSFPIIERAIRDVLERMPWEDFLKVTDRRRPVLFTEVFDSGTAQFANSSEIISLTDDAPAFQDGLTIIKLSTGLNGASNQQAVEGVIAHELAHRVLEHVKKGKRSCAAEREANNLIKQWGFANEYQEASKTFGHKTIGQAVSCQDNG